MLSREDELERLIAEQARDDRDFQPPQPNTVPYGNLMDVLTPDGRVRELAHKQYEQGCAIHGMLDLRPDPSRGSPVCRLCDRERKSRARRVNGDRMRALDRARKRRGVSG
jgi:hypothetical protein